MKVKERCTFRPTSFIFQVKLKYHGEFLINSFKMVGLKLGVHMCVVQFIQEELSIFSNLNWDT